MTTNKSESKKILDERYRQYFLNPIWQIRPPSPQRPENPRLSFFRSPITNTYPHSIATLRQIYNAIRGDFYKAETDHLRTIDDPKKARQYKSSNFDYCTFSGVFSYRNDKALVLHSKLICFDFDNVQDLKDLRFRLKQDEYFDTQLLFVSPSGNGLKWIIAMDNWGVHNHAEYFNAVADYIKQTYNVEVDKSGKDKSRACFLPHDPNVYINPYYLS
jgi:hypothetical protein